MLEARSIEVRPSRDDVTVKALWLQIRCLRKATERERKQSGQPYATCEGFTVDGEPVEYGVLLELPSHATSTVRLERHRIRFEERRGGHLCMALRAIFHQVSPRHDHSLYADPADRYSLLSFCTVEQQPDWAPGRYPFDQNRVETVQGFSEQLSQPIVLNLRPAGRGGAGPG